MFGLQPVIPAILGLNSPAIHHFILHNVGYLPKNDYLCARKGANDKKAPLIEMIKST